MGKTDVAGKGSGDQPEVDLRSGESGGKADRAALRARRIVLAMVDEQRGRSFA